MHGNAIHSHEADPAIDWLAEFESEPPAHDVPELTMYPAVEPESKVHASTKLIAKLPRLATVRPEDTLFRVVVPRRPATLDASEASRFATIEPDPIAETARRIKSAWPGVADAMRRRSARAAALGAIVLVVLSTAVLAGGSALRRWGRLPEPPQPPPVALQAPPVVPTADSSAPAVGQPFRAVTDAPAQPKPAPKSRAVVAPTDRKSKPPASKAAAAVAVPSPLPPAPAPAPAATDNSTASVPPPAAPPLDVATKVTASASPVRTTPVTLETPPARTPAPAPAPARITDSAAIQSVVDRYEQAFSTLSLDGITAFWPSVNTRTLAKAFDQLQEQHLAFDSCRIEVHGDQADAVCGGQTRFVTKIGSRTPRTERHQWAFMFLRQNQGWVIYKVDVK